MRWSIPRARKRPRSTTLEAAAAARRRAIDAAKWCAASRAPAAGGPGLRRRRTSRRRVVSSLCKWDVATMLRACTASRGVEKACPAQRRAVADGRPRPARSSTNPDVAFDLREAWGRGARTGELNRWRDCDRGQPSAAPAAPHIKLRYIPNQTRRGFVVFGNRTDECRQHALSSCARATSSSARSRCGTSRLAQSFDRPDSSTAVGRQRRLSMLTFRVAQVGTMARLAGCNSGGFN